MSRGRWLGVQQSVLREEPEEDEEDNLSCLVNIDMDIGSGRAEARRVREGLMSPDSRYRGELMSPEQRAESQAAILGETALLQN